MDKTKSKNTKVTSPKKQLEPFYVPVSEEHAKDLQDFIVEIEKSRERALSEISKDAKSIFTNKKTLAYILNLINISHEVSKDAMIGIYSLKFANEKIDLLEQAIAILMTKIERLEKLSNVRDVKELKETQKEQEELDAIKAKIKVQCEKEELLVNDKLDKIRQEMLRFDVV